MQWVFFNKLVILCCRGGNLKASPSESSLAPSPSKEVHHSPSKAQSQSKVVQPLQPLPRSPERPLAQCQVKPMPKIAPSISHDDALMKTEFCKPSADDFVPIPVDRPAGLAIDDFLPVSQY